MSTAATPLAAALPALLDRLSARVGTCPAPLPAGRRVQRWERIGLGVRLAYNAQRVDVIRHWLGLGRQLGREGLVDEARVLHRSLGVLLRTAMDGALPPAWRLACLEHTTRPLARLTWVVGADGREDIAELDGLIRRIDDALVAGMARPASRDGCS